MALGRKRGSTGPASTSLRALWVSKKGMSPVLYKITLETPRTDFLFAGLLTLAVSNWYRIAALGKLEDVFIRVFIPA